MLKYLVIMTGLVCTLLLSACNTMEGMGQDIQKGGEKLENKAEDAKLITPIRPPISGHARTRAASLAAAGSRAARPFWSRRH